MINVGSTGSEGLFVRDISAKLIKVVELPENPFFMQGERWPGTIGQLDR